MKHKIPKIDAHKNFKKNIYKIPDHITLVPAYGSPAQALSKYDCSHLYILDMGPNFANIEHTINLLEYYSNPKRKVVWIDHHDWITDIIEEYKEVLYVSKSDSCAELISPLNRGDKTKRTICFSPDADGIISACILIAGDIMPIKSINALVNVAKKCDCADFKGDRLAEAFHMASFMARYKEKIPELIESIINWAILWSEKESFSCNAWLHIIRLCDDYRAEIWSNNKRILATIKYGDNYAIMNTSNIPMADLTSICNHLYTQDVRFVIFENTKHYKISTRDKIDLRILFETDGVPYKVVIDKIDFNIIKERLNEHKL